MSLEPREMDIKSSTSKLVLVVLLLASDNKGFT